MRERQKRAIDTEAVKNFLLGYRMCEDMLCLRSYERKRGREQELPGEFSSILLGNEAYWRARMLAVQTLIGKMKNGREKLMLYYRYMGGETVEHAASLLNISRRTGYRLLERGLYSAALLYERMKRNKEL